jgi:hypothetical protein
MKKSNKILFGKDKNLEQSLKNSEKMDFLAKNLKISIKTRYRILTIHQNPIHSVD